MTRFIHLTDLHISHPDLNDPHLQSDTPATLRRVVEVINAMDPQPDFVVASGDLTNQGDRESYALVRDILSDLRAPLVLALGNHDKRAGFNAVFAPGLADAPYFHDARHGDLHVIALDSSVPNKVAGALDDPQFEFLEAALERHSDLAKLLVIHHPPRIDPDALAWGSLDEASSARLAGMLKGKHVAGILSGHVHVNRVSHWHGIPVVISNGLHSTIDLTETRDLRIVEGTGFGLCDWHSSGLSVAFAPLDPTARELARIGHDRLRSFE
ncbi:MULTISPECIES: metallophosphoesterase family protein [Sulfitobacter]|uniref:3',5'-cyclic adenosine monophosphate phosphodiesterase CpdA n=1 Tax=Sulfitobacter dubius TaxID=218673 RepID=A0ABY3ZPE7_9RHOB|nr:metallophosphoesterase [Sulfitobacter dubius]UOA16392.1 3',5'-cyclic adenosine monophosphate phosphodiesterase CpdA [Sulfitobacter dubius]WOI28081.1 metallophosphoesterase [Sulfitobacter dubius]